MLQKFGNLIFFDYLYDKKNNIVIKKVQSY